MNKKKLEMMHLGKESKKKKKQISNIIIKNSLFFFKSPNYFKKVKISDIALVKMVREKKIKKLYNKLIKKKFIYIKKKKYSTRQTNYFISTSIILIYTNTKKPFFFHKIFHIFF